jgi:hypothetical protein
MKTQIIAPQLTLMKDALDLTYEAEGKDVCA